MNQDQSGGAQDVNPIDYSTDDYPREGCSLVIRFRGGRYEMTVYAPGLKIMANPAGPGRFLEGYFPRPLASIGIAVQAFAAGRILRSFLPQMCEAERVQVEAGDASGSSVTS